MSSITLFSDYHSYYLYAGHVDMKKSFDGLCGVVRNELGREVNYQDVFIFLNKRCTHIKLLLQEADGFTLLYRRLHKGQFTLPVASATDGTIRLSATDLLSMLQGLHLHRVRKKP
jgi:transposase